MTHSCVSVRFPSDGVNARAISRYFAGIRPTVAPRSNLRGIEIARPLNRRKNANTKQR